MGLLLVRSVMEERCMGARGRFTDDPATGTDWSPPCKRSAGKRSRSLRGWGRSDVGAEVGATGVEGGGRGGSGLAEAVQTHRAPEPRPGSNLHMGRLVLRVLWAVQRGVMLA